MRKVKILATEAPRIATEGREKAVPGTGFTGDLRSTADIPVSLAVIVKSGAPPTTTQVAQNNVLKLNTVMSTIYADALRMYQKSLLAVHPVILALFSAEGGHMTLYRPGKQPLVAAEVPIRYQILKSVSHSSMAVFQLVAGYLADPSDQSWRGPMASYRTVNQTALESLDALDIESDVRENLRYVLKGNLKFMEDCLAKGTFTFADLKHYAQELKPYLVKNIKWDAATQVAHWMEVVSGWMQLLGPDWEKTYALSNTLYVTRQNNILFSVLAQFFGKEAMNTRLFLFETPEFTTSANQMLDLLTRIVTDRSVGEVFFGTYYLMDYELMGADARESIEAEDKKRGLEVFLPPLVPFHSHEWPFRSDPSQGKGPGTIEQ